MSSIVTCCIVVLYIMYVKTPRGMKINCPFSSPWLSRLIWQLLNCQPAQADKDGGRFCDAKSWRHVTLMPPTTVGRNAGD